MFSCGSGVQVSPSGYSESDNVPDVLKAHFYPPMPRLDPENKWLPLLTPSQLVEIQTAFKKFDKDGDGHIEPKEIQKIMGGMGLDLSAADVAKLIGSVDDDGSGTVEFDEFVDILANQMIVQDGQNELNTAFALFDPMQTGFLDAAHARELLCHSGARPLSSAEADGLMSQLQTDSSGRISMEAFRELKCWQMPPDRPSTKVIASVVEDVNPHSSSMMPSPAVIPKVVAAKAAETAVAADVAATAVASSISSSRSGAAATAGGEPEGHARDRMQPPSSEPAIEDGEVADVSATNAAGEVPATDQ